MCLYDVIVIGGGPAGMIAAGRAAERGARVLLLEKNNNLGIKLLATGNSRCNLTNNQADDKKLITQYGPNGKFLLSAFYKFDVASTINFFRTLGIDTTTENNNRVFPVSNKAKDVRDGLLYFLRKNKVEIKTNSEVIGVISANKYEIEKAQLSDGKMVLGKNFIITTGGKSNPQTGSTGDAYEWFSNLGHNVYLPRPALAPIILKEKFIKQLEGLSLSGIEVKAYKNDKKILEKRGDLIFTSNGVSGPVIIDISSQIGVNLPGKIKFSLDFKPDTSTSELENKIQADFHLQPKKILKNYLESILPSRLSEIILQLAEIDKTKEINSILKNERKKLLHFIKELSLEVKDLEGFNKAMITAGGIDCKEIDPKTMKSKLYNNLYAAGEVLDVDGPSGGYNLQICWSTGFVAGDSVIF